MHEFKVLYIYIYTQSLKKKTKKKLIIRLMRAIASFFFVSLCMNEKIEEKNQ